MERVMPSVEGVYNAAQTINKVCKKTPLELNERLSELVHASVLLKREDLQQIRSFKIRGAFNKIASLTNDECEKGIVCASAGNHAQGFALACKQLKIFGVIYMPATTPQQKIAQVAMFGGSFVRIELTGDTYDACQKVAIKIAYENNKILIHSFDDLKVIEGQATIALEMLEQNKGTFDYIIVPIGGGGLISGIITVFKKLSPSTKIIGVEPEGASSMKFALDRGECVALNEMDPFVDGAAVKKVGDLPYAICKDSLDKIITVPEGKICQSILDLYNIEGIVAEPAGALAISALDFLGEEVRGASIGVLLCGGNNDILRMPEIKERALLYANLKHYFLVQFPQRAGSLKQFVSEILGPNDDITYFEFSKKSFRPNTTALVGIEVLKVTDYQRLVDSMKSHNFKFDYLNNKQSLFEFLI